VSWFSSVGIALVLILCRHSHYCFHLPAGLVLAGELKCRDIAIQIARVPAGSRAAIARRNRLAQLSGPIRQVTVKRTLHLITVETASRDKRVRGAVQQPVVSIVLKRLGMPDAMHV
jgi:hypothetical protein